MIATLTRRLRCLAIAILRLLSLRLWQHGSWRQALHIVLLAHRRIAVRSRRSWARPRGRRVARKVLPVLLLRHVALLIRARKGRVVRDGREMGIVLVRHGVGSRHWIGSVVGVLWDTGGRGASRQVLPCVHQRLYSGNGQVVQSIIELLLETGGCEAMADRRLCDTGWLAMLR